MITLILGPMYAGKSTELWRIWHSAEGKPRAAYCPAMLSGHRNGEAINARGLGSIPAEPMPIDGGQLIDHGVVLIDEAHFFSPNWPKAVWRWQCDHAVDVYVAALATDSDGNTWPTTGQWACYANRIQQLYARCTVCGQRANLTACVARREPFHTSVFEPRCVAHFATGVREPCNQRDKER